MQVHHFQSSGWRSHHDFDAWLMFPGHQTTLNRQQYWKLPRRFAVALGWQAWMYNQPSVVKQSIIPYQISSHFHLYEFWSSYQHNTCASMHSAQSTFFRSRKVIYQSMDRANLSIILGNQIFLNSTSLTKQTWDWTCQLHEFYQLVLDHIKFWTSISLSIKTTKIKMLFTSN
jgi:hypothetical protein